MNAIALSITEVIPDIGEVKNAPIVEIAVKPGDVVQAGDTLAMVESDKATLDIPAAHGGTVVRLLVELGAKVSAGSPLLELAPAEGAPASAPPAGAPAPAETAAIAVIEAPAAPVTAPVPPIAPVVLPAEAAEGQPVHAGPGTRKLARDLGVDLGAITGTGPKGRVLVEDVQAHVKARLAAPAQPAATAAPGTLLGLPAWPEVDFARFGPIETEALSRIRRISGPALARNAVVIPHVTNFDQADITDLEAFRLAVKSEGAAKLTALAFAVKASVAALKAYPAFNSSLQGDQIVLKRYWHIGFAADTPDGLVVPVVRDADRKGLIELAEEMAELAGLARTGKLRPEQMQGASFTISSLGGIGGTGFTPIINAPEVAILGMGRAAMQPVWDGTAFQPRLIQPLSLSWDHRVIDGAAAARFLGHVARSLGDFRRISL